MADVSERRKGLVHGVLAYALWGIMAAYWKLLAHVKPVELLAHRAVWGLLAFGALVVITKQLRAVGAAIRDTRVLATMALSASSCSRRSRIASPSRWIDSPRSP